MRKLSRILTCLVSLGLFTSQAYADKVSFIVPTRTIYAGQPVSSVGLSEKQFYIKKEAISLYATDIAQVLDKVAKRTLVSGRPIPISAVDNAILIERGKSVQLVFSAGDLRITATGVALQPGVAGDQIKLRNVDTGRIVSGMVLENGSVRVGVQ